MTYTSSFKVFVKNNVPYYAIGMLGVRNDQVDHMIDMKFIAELDTLDLSWKTVILESKDGFRVSVNCQSVYLRVMELQLGELVEVLIDKITNDVWMLERMKAERWVEVAPGKNIGDKIEKIHKTSDQYPFLEKNLPEEVKETEPLSALSAAAATLLAQVPTIKKEQETDTSEVKGKKEGQRENPSEKGLQKYNANLG